MFSFETNGYSRKEVDDYISKIKNDLLEKKVCLLNSEERFLQLKQKNRAIEEKEKRLVQVLLSIEKSQLNLNNDKRENLFFSQKTDDFFALLWKLYPNLKNDDYIFSMGEEIRAKIVKSGKGNDKISKKDDNDSMRKILNKMHSQKSDRNSRKVKIERNLKPVFDKSDNIDDFLSKKPDERIDFANLKQEKGFNIEEAVNPKEDLDQIMKAFDFFNND